MKKGYRTKPADIGIANISETRQIVISHVKHPGGNSTFKINERALCTELGTNIETYRFFKGGFVLRSIESMYALRDAFTDAIVAYEKQNGLFSPEKEKDNEFKPMKMGDILGEVVIPDGSALDKALVQMANAQPILVNDATKPKSEVISLVNLTNAQLRDMLDKQCVEYRKKATKAELIELLNKPTDIDSDDEEWID